MEPLAPLAKHAAARGGCAELPDPPPDTSAAGGGAQQPLPPAGAADSSGADSSASSSGSDLIPAAWGGARSSPMGSGIGRRASSPGCVADTRALSGSEARCTTPCSECAPSRAAPSVPAAGCGTAAEQQGQHHAALVARNSGCCPCLTLVLVGSRPLSGAGGAGGAKELAAYSVRVIDGEREWTVTRRWGARGAAEGGGGCSRRDP